MQLHESVDQERTFSAMKILGMVRDSRSCNSEESMNYFVLWYNTLFLFNGFSSVFLCACVCCSITVLTGWVAPPKMVYNWYRV